MRSVVNGNRKLIPGQIAMELHYQVRKQTALCANALFALFIVHLLLKLLSCRPFAPPTALVRTGAIRCLRGWAGRRLGPRWRGPPSPLVPATLLHSPTRLFRLPPPLQNMLFLSPQAAFMDFLWRFGGYHILERHDNGGCYACTELLLARDIRAPPPARREALDNSDAGAGAAGQLQDGRRSAGGEGGDAASMEGVLPVRAAAAGSRRHIMRQALVKQ